MRIVVTGMIATYPVGGVAWDYGQYALGLERLGADVLYLEDTGGPTYDPDAGQYGDDPRYGVAFLRGALAQLSPTLGERWHFRAADGRTFGLPADEVAAFVRDADAFVNVSGSCLLRREYLASRRKILIDTDPGWNHFVNWPRWDQGGGVPGVASWRAHDAFFTYATNLGQPGCELPTLGIAWQPTLPPVVMPCWRAPAADDGAAWTTVMTWNNFGRPIEHAGRSYGTKELEFGRIEDLPARTGLRLEVAVGGSGAPTARWRELGWNVRSSEGVSRTVAAYRDYVLGSRGELSVGKNVYVATRSGWFSCRSACYLAAGRPVVLQDTGFSRALPTGAGLFAFDDGDGAAAALTLAERDPAFHATVARRIARDHLAAEVVLGDLLRAVGLDPARAAAGSSARAPEPPRGNAAQPAREPGGEVGDGA